MNMQAYIRTVNLVSQTVGVIAASMIVIAVAITCQMIFIRYFLNGSTIWQTEAVIYLMVGATLLGLPYVQKLKGHVNVDLVPMLLPPVARKITDDCELFGSCRDPCRHDLPRMGISSHFVRPRMGVRNSLGPSTLDSIPCDATWLWPFCTTVAGGSF
jgi:hypothetical protein